MVAEHHLTTGVASSQPALLLGQIAANTDRIRLGSGALQTGYLTPQTMVERLEALRRVTGADELLVTTIAHDHDERVRSFELPAKHRPG